MDLPVRSLSIHANYRCGHSGACCTAGWPIPVERETARELSAAIDDGRLEVAARLPSTRGRALRSREPRPTTCSPMEDARPAMEDALVTADDAPAETPVVTATDEHGACAFYERDRKRCAIHRQLGEQFLPDACRQFPRVSLLDGRGLSVTLSHFCPTAAALLFEEKRLRVAQMPAAFPPAFPFDPLDARDALPPLLHPGVLLDLDTFGAWERAAVAICDQRGYTAEQALTAVSETTERLRSWEPGRRDARGVLREATIAAIDRADGAGRHQRAFDAERAAASHALVLRAIPQSVRPAPIEANRIAEGDARFVADGWPLFAPTVRRYLAAKIFGSWLAYQGRGLRTIVFSASVALSLVRAHAAVDCARRAHPLDRHALTTAIRRADELLLHLASPQPLADELSRIETSLAGPGPLGLL